MHKVPLTDSDLPNKVPGKNPGDDERRQKPTCPECDGELVPSRRAAGKWLCVSCKIRFDEKDVMPEDSEDGSEASAGTGSSFDGKTYEDASRWLGEQLSRLSADIAPDMPSLPEKQPAGNFIKEKLSFAWEAIKELFPSGRKNAPGSTGADLGGLEEDIVPDGEPEPIPIASAADTPTTEPRASFAEPEEGVPTAGPSEHGPESLAGDVESDRVPHHGGESILPEQKSGSEKGSEPETVPDPARKGPFAEDGLARPDFDARQETRLAREGDAPAPARDELPYLDEAFSEEWDDLEEELPFAAEAAVPRGGYSPSTFAPVPTRIKRRPGNRRPLATENRSALLMAGGAAGAFIILGFVIFLVTGSISTTGNAESAGNESNSAMNAMADMLSIPSSNANSVDRNAGDSYNAQDSSITENEAIRRLDEANGGHSVSEKMHDIPKIEDLKKQAEEEQKAREEAKKAAEEAEAAEKATTASSASSNGSTKKASSNKGSND